MRRVLARVAAFFGSLDGRLTLILTIGTTVAAMLSLLVAEQARKRDFQHVRLERVVASTADIINRLHNDPVGTARALREYRIIGAEFARSPGALPPPDKALAALLVARLGARAQPYGVEMPPAFCLPKELDVNARAAGMVEPPRFDCWYVRFTDAGGVARRLAIDLPPFRIPPSATLDPIYLLLILFASAILSFLVARFMTGPLRRLTAAARAFSLSIDPEPIPEIGPPEVRTALATFNVMQNRIRDGFRERTQILAAIAHDLQTPLTRLRLRLEKVEDAALRDRLIADLGVMQALVRDGLDLARSSESREPWSMVDIDSLLSSLCEDASEFCADVRFAGGCGARVRVKPNALGRCVTNLIDNALQYGGDAEVDCVRVDAHVEVRVRDHGPGIDAALLPTIFDPFVRQDSSRSRETGGTGIGLTIARAQAATFGATLTLASHPGGGAIARIAIPT